MNFTAAGDRKNDENTIVVRSKAHAAQFEDWFDKLWTSIDGRYLTQQPDPESSASGTSCDDGIDNDFDDRADGGDPGCGPRPPALPALPPIVHQIPLASNQTCSWELVK